MNRAELLACLARVERDLVLESAERVASGLEVEALAPAEAGLALLQWRDAVLGQPFYLGEVPVARAAVALARADGARAEGGAVVMADDAELARALAVLDAVYGADWPGAELVEALARRGAERQARTQAIRAAMLERTRVDFALLGDGGEGP